MTNSHQNQSNAPIYRPNGKSAFFGLLILSAIIAAGYGLSSSDQKANSGSNSEVPDDSLEQPQERNPSFNTSQFKIK